MTTSEEPMERSETIYLRQLYAQGYWRVRLKAIDIHSGQHSNVHTWVIYPAFGGRTPKQAESTQVSHIFVRHECKRVLFRKLPRTWRNEFRRQP